MSFFEPSPTLIALIFVKRFVFLELLLVLALVRTGVGRGPSRLIALLTALFCAGAILTTFAPALGLTAHALYGPAARTLAYGQGLSLLLGLSALFVTSALVPTRRMWPLDWLNLALVLGLLGLWIASLF
ncbi:hypothetical protein P775_09600 [Puniceibacterium antarcticum]|uniref:Uncharacterized protein n=1 Tax=Puniceibacterium antarcticum TaxID=1206336 RepID=A0A2G8RFM1_9RHOB|nr:hypothetical protein [Puniceibacterium antarcticum]PIL20384.1 hypothetical protein P775_09600 [Puniceibacterium antarcticum]